MEKYFIGQRVIDIRNGKNHKIIDMEIICGINLIYTETTSIPSDYLIDSKEPLWIQLLNRKKSGENVTEWLLKNGSLKVSLNSNFDFDLFCKNCLRE